jgi:hypothetical protein
MSTTYEERNTKSSMKQLESLISSAVKKVGAKKENDICRYIPAQTGGYIHHFTMRKMKTEAPEQLAEMISKYIVNADKPVTVRHKPRAPRGSRKRRDQFVFSRTDLDRLLTIARLAGDKDMVRKLTPKKDLRTIKKDLISSIRLGRIEPELWSAYAEGVAHYNAVVAAGSSIAAPAAMTPGI